MFYIIRYSPSVKFMTCTNLSLPEAERTLESLCISYPDHLFTIIQIIHQGPGQVQLMNELNSNLSYSKLIFSE